MLLVVVILFYLEHRTKQLNLSPWSNINRIILWWVGVSHRWRILHHILMTRIRKEERILRTARTFILIFIQNFLINFYLSVLLWSEGNGISDGLNPYLVVGCCSLCLPQSPNSVLIINEILAFGDPLHFPFRSSLIWCKPFDLKKEINWKWLIKIWKRDVFVVWSFRLILGMNQDRCEKEVSS